MIEDIAGWIAPAATMIAAMMTAANLGARITGYGFVVFLVGSITWIVVAFASGQSNLLYTNVFLALVNLIGIWRWLGRQAAYEDAAAATERESEAKAGPSLRPIGSLIGAPVHDPAGNKVGHIVELMGDASNGRIAYLVLREGGTATLRERLHAIPWQQVVQGEADLAIALDAQQLAALPGVETDHWPAQDIAEPI